VTTEQTFRPRRRAAALATFSGAAANTFVVTLQAVVLIPLYLRYVGARLYGAWLGSGDLLVWLQALDLGIPNLMIQRIGAAHGRGDQRTAAIWFRSGMAMLFLVSGLFWVVGWILAGSLPGWFGLDDSNAAELSGCFRAGVVGVCVLLANNGVVALSRGIQKTALMNVFVVLAGGVGFLASWATLVLGKGLWALPAGILTRAALSLVGSAIFVGSVWRSEGLGIPGHDNAVFREMVRTSPAIAVAGIVYASTTYLDTALVAIVVGPAQAVVFNLTRKAMDVVRALLDTVGYASYGGFAHLAASKERHRAARVLSEIRQVRWAVGLAAAMVYIGLNGSFMALWVGPERFGGQSLSTLFMLQTLITGESYLLNYLYRATGAVVEGSILLILEGASRMLLAIVLLFGVGTAGIPAAAAIVATAFAVVVGRRLTHELGGESPAPSFLNWRRVGLGFGCCAASAILAVAFPIRGWLPLAVVAVIYGALGFLLLIRPVLSGLGIRLAQLAQPNSSVPAGQTR
jgi:O-antigen/teichoic acid export membrane protein